jgi:hypothetical protein
MTQLEKLGFIFEVSLESSRAHLDTEIFGEVFLDAIDSALSMLGNCAKNAVYESLESNYDICKERIPHEVEAFANALEEIFGQAAQLIEIRIMRVLHQKVPSFNFSFDDYAFSFVGYVERLRFFL